MAGLNAGGASPLLGAFLAGLSFCTIRSLEHVWKSQVKRLQTWYVRVCVCAAALHHCILLMMPLPIALPSVQAGAHLLCVYRRLRRARQALRLGRRVEARRRLLLRHAREAHGGTNHWSI
jgi:Flp pilus assembly protein TadB